MEILIPMVHFNLKKCVRMFLLKTFIIFSLFLIFHTGCVTMDHVRYDYYDGNGNHYRIIQEKEIVVEFIPVKPKKSSSGFYDGGTPAKKTVTTEVLKPVIIALELAIGNTDVHIQNRIKRSGMISRHQSGITTVVIIRPDSEEIEMIEKTLSLILK